MKFVTKMTNKYIAQESRCILDLSDIENLRGDFDLIKNTCFTSK